jgi:hypothetical protein
MHAYFCFNEKFFMVKVLQVLFFVLCELVGRGRFTVRASGAAGLSASPLQVACILFALAL